MFDFRTVPVKLTIPEIQFLSDLLISDLEVMDEKRDFPGLRLLKGPRWCFVGLEVVGMKKKWIVAALVIVLSLASSLPAFAASFDVPCDVFQIATGADVDIMRKRNYWKTLDPLSLTDLSANISISLGCPAGFNYPVGSVISGEFRLKVYGYKLTDGWLNGFGNAFHSTKVNSSSSDAYYEMDFVNMRTVIVGNDTEIYLTYSFTNRFDNYPPLPESGAVPKFSWRVGVYLPGLVGSPETSTAKASVISLNVKTPSGVVVDAIENQNNGWNSGAMDDANGQLGDSLDKLDQVQQGADRDLSQALDDYQTPDLDGISEPVSFVVSAVTLFWNSLGVFQVVITVCLSLVAFNFISRYRGD